MSVTLQNYIVNYFAICNLTIVFVVRRMGLEEELVYGCRIGIPLELVPLDVVIGELCGLIVFGKL